MADNRFKTPVAKSLVENATKQVLDAIQLIGKALPASVVSVDMAIVTVKFEVVSGFTLPQVTMPLFGPEWIRYPINAGTKGVVYPADARLGAMSGLGGGTANLSQPANLASLVFFPIGNKNWRRDDIEPDEVTIYGPEGVKIRTENREWTLWLTREGIGIYNGDNLVMSVDGGFNEINIFNRNLVVNNGDLIVDGLSFKRHLHGGVTPGGGNSGKPSGNGP